MRRARHLFVLAAMLVAGACRTVSPVSPVSPSPVVTISRPLVLSGQSNALLVAPSLSAIYPLPVLTVAENGRPISGWAATADRWKELLPQLQQPIQAFAWWQGESDRDNTNYLSDLRDLIARVRQVNGDPQLLVIEVRVLNLPANASVRAAQEAFVQADTNAVLISSDGFQLDSTDHLTDAGYRMVAQRILDAIRSAKVR
jgi:Carbohydrate esterase, sialic acid-specific acetylesterase